VAWDVALNFVERWKQQAPTMMEGSLRHIDHKDVLLTDVLQKFTVSKRGVGVCGEGGQSASVG
jgi:hypothetical protein